MRPLFLLALFSFSCGYSSSVTKIGPNHYRLSYCDPERKCSEAAKKVCPKEYRVIKYGSIRPEEFVCE